MDLSGPPAENAAPERPLLSRKHKMYHRGAGLHHYFVSRIRPAGIGFCALVILAACLVPGHESTPVYQLFSLGVGMGWIAIIWALFRRAKLEGKRELPKFATAGETLRFHVLVKNRGRRRVTRAWLYDFPPDPRPTVEAFSFLREPGEEERNWVDQRLAYFRWQWLLLGNCMFVGRSSSEELSLAPKQQIRIALEITPLRRGVVRLNDLRVLLPDPFGLFQRCRKVEAPPATLTVLPKRYKLPPIELPGGAAFKVSGEANTNTIGTSGEFVGLRDYRPGDPLRQIHWKSWARTGRPIVKELEDTHYPRYGLVVDTLSNADTDFAFEEVISVAASFAASIDSSESLLDLMFIKNEAHLVTAGRSLERVEKLLEVLAGVSPQRSEDYSALASLIIRHGDDLTSCLVILNGWDESRAEFLSLLRRNGILCAPIIIGAGKAPAGVPGSWLESGNIAQSLQRLPTRLAIPI